ncbi:putative F-box protein [Cardamine amara subsp. amara]|uniref:F-box protein n=1 Tax=Cardamine amara subsp. amara TaxID=228776 RepID=A0ABD1AK36_CARAN
MSTSSFSSLTLDLTSDIVLRLPADSVVRCRYVSKLWSSITTDPYFTNTFETRSSARPRLLMFFRKKGKLFVFSFPQHNKNSNEPHDSYSRQHVDSYHMKYPRDCHFSISEGRLACLDSYNFMDKDGFTLWILEDPEQNQWSSKHFPTPFIRSLENVYKINGITNAGEFICVPSNFVKSFFILYFDPKRNSLREVEFKGIADEEFRFSNGLGKGRIRGLFTFPNHVENFMSLKY